MGTGRGWRLPLKQRFEVSTAVDDTQDKDIGGFDGVHDHILSNAEAAVSDAKIVIASSSHIRKAG